MPAVNQSGRHSLSRYLNVRQAYFPSFSSDGARMAFVSDITGIPQLWMMHLASEIHEPLWPDQWTFANERVMGAWFSPATGDGRLIYARDTGGDENAQLFLLSADGASDALLTAGHERAMHTFGAWSADGTRILFAANRRHPGIFDLYVQALDGEPRLVWKNDRPGFLSHLKFSPDGQRAVFARSSSSFAHDLFEVDLASGSARQLNPSDRAARYESVCYAADGRSLFMNTDLRSDFLYVARYDFEAQTFHALVSTQHDIELLTISPDGRQLAYAVNVDGTSELRLHDLAQGASRMAPTIDAIPGVVAMLDEHLAFSPDSRQLAFSFTSAIHTSDIFIWDLKGNRVRTLTRSSHGGLSPVSFIAPKLIHYPTFDGRPIPGWFYEPKGSLGQRVPAVVVVHGGPEAQARPSFQFMIQYLLEHGLAILAPNVRGSSGYGKAYSHLDDVEHRLDSVKDLSHAAYWLRGQPGIDRDRLAVYGGSYGGFMVLAALTHDPDLWAAGVDIVGISNFVTFLENTSEYRRAHREAEYGSLAHDRALLERISPINHVDRIKAPLIVLHGANDPRVPVSEAEQLVTTLRSRHVPVELLVFNDEGHGIVKLHNKLRAYPAIIDFLNTHLKR